MIKKIVLFLGGVLVLFLSLGVYNFIKYDVPKVSYGTTLKDGRGEIFYHILSPKDEWHIEGTGEISPKLKESVLTYEDKRFYSHCGVDLRSIGRAFVKNILGKRRSGASTISMQLVKSLEPERRTYLNKYREIFRTLKLETLFTKDEILRMYLNNSPYGGNIRGYETAARMYFRKDPKNLSWAQSALLAVLPNAPGMMSVEKNRPLLKRKRDMLLKKLYDKGSISLEEYRFSIKEGLPRRRYSLNRGGYHLAKKLGRKYPGEIINSSLDLSIQEKISEIASSYERQISEKKIDNLGILIIENKGAKVRGYYGSNTYWDVLSMERSPGSTLKPFLFALGIEEGLILPRSKYPDVPTYFGNFAPENSDGEFHGMVRMEGALKNSYNLPFVYLLRDYGADKFYYFLQSTLNKEDMTNRAGLSLILGGKEYTALDLGYLYTALASNGQGRELSFLSGEDSKKSTKVLNEGSSILTRASLEEVLAPSNFEGFKRKNKIAWKTGTSFGRKDAWACGFNDTWTVIVWVGNIDRRGNENIRGDETAGTLFFRIFKYLVSEEARKEEAAINKEGILRKIKIDKETGYRLPKDFTGEYEEVLAPRDGILIRESPYLKKIFVNSRGEEIDSRDEDFVNRKKKFILDYPEEVKKFYKSKVEYGKGLKILYPTNGVHIFLPKDLDGKREMVMKVSNPRKENLYWYLNGEYLGHGREDLRSIFLYPGNYVLTVVSESYEEISVSFQVDV